MAHERCNICEFATGHRIIKDYTIDMQIRHARFLEDEKKAGRPGLSIDDFAAAKSPHISFDAVVFEPHNGPCGKPCSGSVPPSQRGKAPPGWFHDGMACPCVSHGGEAN